MVMSFQKIEKLSLTQLHADHGSVLRGWRALCDLSLDCYRPLSPDCRTHVS